MNSAAHCDPVIKALNEEDVHRLKNLLKNQSDSTPFPVTRFRYDFKLLANKAFLKFRFVEMLELPIESMRFGQHVGNPLAYAILHVNDAEKMTQCIRLMVEHFPQSILNVSSECPSDHDHDAPATSASASSSWGRNQLFKRTEISPLDALVFRAQRDNFEPGSVMRNTFDFLVQNGADITHRSSTSCYKSPDVAIWAAIMRNPVILCAVLSTGKVDVVRLAEDIQHFATDEMKSMPTSLGVYNKYVIHALIGSAMIIMCHYSAMDGRVMSALEKITQYGICVRDNPGALDMIKRFIPAQVIPLREKCRAIIRQRLAETGAVSANGSIEKALASIPIPESQKWYISEPCSDALLELANQLRLRLTKATHKRRPGALHGNDRFFGEDTVIDHIRDDESDYESPVEDSPPEYDSDDRFDTFEKFPSSDDDSDCSDYGGYMDFYAHAKYCY